MSRRRQKESRVRYRRHWRSACCGAPRPWKHAMDCPLVDRELRPLLYWHLRDILLRRRNEMGGGQR